MPEFSTQSKPRVLFVLDPVLGHVTVHLRGLMFQAMFRRNGWEVDFVTLRTSGRKKLNSWSLRRVEDRIVRQSQGYDVVYLLKVASLRLVEKLKAESSARVAFDLTDALWMPVHREHGWRDLEEILKLSDAVTSENEFICEFGRRYNETVLSIPVCTQIERFDALRTQVPLRSEKPIRLGWVGSPGTVSALEKIREPLDALFSKHDHLELRVLGSGKTPLPNFKQVRWSTLAEYDEEAMLREILQMHIGLFPAPGDAEDYRIRGALKGLLYMSGGAVPVCLNLGDSPNKIEDGVTGLLIDPPLQEPNFQQGPAYEGGFGPWFEKLDALVQEPDRLCTMGQKATESVRECHSMERVFSCLEAALVQIANLSKPPHPALAASSVA